MPDSNPHTRNTMDCAVYRGNTKYIIPAFTEFMFSGGGSYYIIHLSRGWTLRGEVEDCSHIECFYHNKMDAQYI